MLKNKHNSYIISITYRLRVGVDQERRETSGVFQRLNQATAVDV